MNYTFIITKGEEFYIGTVKELPEINTQGETISKTKENLKDALALFLECIDDEKTLQPNL